MCVSTYVICFVYRISIRMCKLLAPQLERVMVLEKMNRDLGKYVTSGRVYCYRDLPTVLNILLIVVIDIRMYVICLLACS